MGQASTSKVLASVRHRRQFARLLVTNGCAWSSINGPVTGIADMTIASILSGASAFDVHAARELGKRMVAMSDEQAVFEDWTRAKGLGPGNRDRGAFVSVAIDADWGTQEWAAGQGYKFECAGSCGVPRRGGWPGCLARAYAKTGGKASAAMGRSIARHGQRLLDAIEGQPSECQAGPCRAGNPETACYGQPCPDCLGTGHNLTGVLPQIEWSPAIRRKAPRCHTRRMAIVST